MIGSLIGIIASSGGAAAAAGDFESIATVTVGSGGSSSISFTSIPSTYQHLQLRTLAKHSTALELDDSLVRFNSDSGSNYFLFHQLRGNGASATAAAGSTSTSMYVLPVTGSSVSTFAGGVMDILDYDDANKYKTVRTLTGYDANGSGNIFLRSALWMNTAAVTSITITPPSGTFIEYSSFALYGIKG
jgi:hypothetical protein